MKNIFNCCRVTLLQLFCLAWNIAIFVHTVEICIFHATLAMFVSLWSRDFLFVTPVVASWNLRRPAELVY